MGGGRLLGPGIAREQPLGGTNRSLRVFRRSGGRQLCSYRWVPSSGKPQSARQAVAAPVNLRGMLMLRLRTAWNCRPVPWCAYSPWFAALCHALPRFARLPRASPGDRSSRQLLCARGVASFKGLCAASSHFTRTPSRGRMCSGFSRRRASQRTRLAWPSPPRATAPSSVEWACG